MIEQLRAILTAGVERALTEEAASLDTSKVMKGKGEAYKEVLQVIDALEKQGEESVSEDSDSSATQETE